MWSIKFKVSFPDLGIDTKTEEKYNTNAEVEKRDAELYYLGIERDYDYSIFKNNKIIPQE